MRTVDELGSLLIGNLPGNLEIPVISHGLRPIRDIAFSKIFFWVTDSWAVVPSPWRNITLLL